ncbi:MAG: DNA polymerase II large subunit [Candidatus Diapherotrites archaeon]|nr:DNA polymerase II large subunit [Candidatus Diapherotrites archaeon]
MIESFLLKQIECDKETRRYFNMLAEKVSEQYEIAKIARSLGKDVSSDVESKPSLDLGERCENIVGPKGIAKRYAELYKEENNNREKAVFRLFEEILTEKWVKLENREKRLEQAIKSCLMIITEGVVVAPIDGVPSVRISKNFDDSEYVDIYFAGPIRAAGGTAQVFPLILGDLGRKILGLDRYKPTEDEIERYVEECQIYDEIFTRQYKLTPDEVRAIVRGCPVCINGEPTEDREVAIYKDLPRIPSNRVRGGMCLVISEGIALKAKKILSYAKMLNLDWNWLEEIIKVDKNISSEDEDVDYKYISRMAAGRPIFSYPGKKFGFRLRYGRCRNTGIMAKAIHPATMYLLDEFIAVGTQLKVEKPGKSAEIFPCDSIEGPIVKLKNGEVRKIESVEEAQLIRDEVDQFLFLGDYLCSIGDFRKSANNLLPVGYCEEWWCLELEKLQKEAEEKGINVEKLIKDPNNIDPFTAVEISMQLPIALHPKYTFYFNCAEKEDILELIKEAKNCEKIFEDSKIVKLIFPYKPKIKKVMEDIGLPHTIENNNIIVGKTYAYPLLKTLGYFSELTPNTKKSILEILEEISGIKIKDKCGTFVGLRMGRPEAAKAREMEGKPHVLFPIGLYGGPTRSINKAIEYSEKTKEPIKVEIKIYYCEKCKKVIDNLICHCGNKGKNIFYCPKCKKHVFKDKCEECTSETIAYEEYNLDIKSIFERALKNLGMQNQYPEIVKGVRGLINEDKTPEPLEKGILRAKYDLHVYRDGTIRFDMINAPLTHFKPIEIGTSIEKLKELGYTKDMFDKDLKDEDQILELFVQDIIINEEAAEFLIRECGFIDELLVKFYGLKSYYNVKNKEDLVGQIILGLAPHTSAAVVGRIIGFTKARVCFAHPYFHLAKRRNADGDQDSIMLLLDVLLNFSNKYLPIKRGGRMDAPLVFTTNINPQEIDNEVYEMEICEKYPLELYEKSLTESLPNIDNIEIVSKRLGKESQYRGLKFTHNTKIFDIGPKFSRYVQLKSMEDKIKRQAELQAKIRAVDQKDALERVLMSHFLPDIIGNARSFSKQSFRCTNCNEKYRRIPLSGKCKKCGKGNIVLTIAEGSVKKYLKIAKDLVRQYNLSNYIRQRIDLIEQEVQSIFLNERREQKKILDYKDEDQTEIQDDSKKYIPKKLFEFV